MSIKTLIFDFDGTIADTLDEIIHIYNKIAPQFQCKMVKEVDKMKLRAQKAQQLLKDYGITKLKLPFIVLKIHKELHEKISKIKPIEGMIQALKELKSSGFNLGIMTSNSEMNIRAFLEINKLSDIFGFIYSGKNVFGKARVIKKLLHEQKIKKGTSIYIGDETRDIEAAKKVKIPILAVSWGFNSKEVLSSLKPDFIVDSPNSILHSLRNNSRNC